MPHSQKAPRPKRKPKQTERKTRPTNLQVQCTSLQKKRRLLLSRKLINLTPIWYFTVDPATQAQAQADIAEDGYWGVSQTSQRILDFATALTGGDPDKIEEMRSAFLKGYKQAEKTWGGNLPDISKQTYDAVMKGFDDMAAAAKKVEATEE